MPVAAPQHTGLPAGEGEVAVRRARPIYRVFVSSTWMDLQPERRALMDALNRMEEMRFVGMEFFGNRPDDTHDASIDQVDKCEVFVGIIGHRYGSGITEAEYRRARQLGLPCFVYFRRGEAAHPELTDQDPVLAAKLAAFKQDVMRDHTIKEFGRPEELAANATADLHNWVAARWISVEREMAAAVARTRPARADADRTNVLRLVERIEQDWVKGVLEASLHHRAWLELGLDWRDDAVEHPWDRIVVAPDRPIQTLSKEDSITGVFDSAQHTLLVLGEPGAGKTTTVLELARDLIARARESAAEPVPVVLALSTWRGQQKDLTDWLVAELGLRYQVPKRVARVWLEEGRLMLILDGLDEVVASRRADCVDAINAFEQAHHPPGLAVTCRVVEYEALTTKLRLRSAICLQPLTPAQIERYFQAAGANLDPLRLALRDDAGLRELARSPLMLSVMTMAWRDPGQTTAPFAKATSPEELRRQLFDAYVSAALNRRGKATGGYTPEQTTRWLTWLACRMKENGHTVFALEQLQPGWLGGTGSQLGYFLTTRLLGTVGLALPYLFFFNRPLDERLLVVGLGAAIGAYIGAIDFGFARHGWGGFRRAALRFWTLGVALVLAGGAVAALSLIGEKPGASIFYLFLVGLAFCTPLDVRGLDIKPGGSMQWSWRLALVRGLACLTVGNLFVMLSHAFAVGVALRDHGLGSGWAMLGGSPYLAGLAVGSAAVFAGWRLLRPAANWWNVAQAATLAMVGGQIGGSLDSATAGTDRFWNVGLTFGEFMPVILLGVFGGFASTMIDPARPQKAGAWFWLRVPVAAFLVMTLVLAVPGIVLLALGWGDFRPGETAEFAGFNALVAVGGGLIAFLRFGGFNGVQHFLLRWQLARSGVLPPRPEAFFNHAAQLALMQKVGLGYRFVHALLLEHLAVTKGGAAARGAAETAAGSARLSPGPNPVRALAGRVVRSGALIGLLAALILFSGMGAASLSLDRGDDIYRSADLLPPILGGFLLALALAIPAVLLGGRGCWRLSWRWLGAAWLVLGLILGWLAADDPVIRRPVRLEEIAPAFPGAEESYAVLMRYGYRHPAGKNFKEKLFNFGESPEYPRWREFVSTHRAEIEANWAMLVPVRAWIDELNRFDRIGDLTSTVFGAETVSYRVWSPFSQNVMARASLQALDGQGDAALATLLPMLEVGDKLAVSARAQTHFQQARDMQTKAIRIAGWVLDTAPVSAASRARFAAALVARNDGPAGARRYYQFRSATVLGAATSFGRAVELSLYSSNSFVRIPLDLVGPVIFNRRTAVNELGDLLADLEEFAARREPDRIKPRLADFATNAGRPRFKNVGGAWFGWEMYTELGLKYAAKQVKLYWEMQDRRAALHARLLKP